MQRFEVNQAILDLFEAPAYLEIGVHDGKTFHAVKAARKVAVDPVFVFDVEAAKVAPENRACEYHQITSDAYFSDQLEEGDKFDLIFLDGLHTFDQTLKDLLNAIECLKFEGVIVIDDIMPSSYGASLPDLERMKALRQIIGGDGAWMGDVYRLVFFISQYMPFYSFATMGENHGQLVLWRERRPSTGAAPIRVETIARLDYADAMLNAGLFAICPLEDILERLSRVRRDVRNGGI